jgi:ferritin-like metal-binding protein YciE
MSSPKTLNDLYIEELRDLWSANDQMQKILPKLSAESGDKLRSTLDKAIEGIKQHTEVLKSLIDENGGKASKDHCKGMEGLVKEAQKHVLEDEIEDSDIRDAIILSQYQRMCHYGLAGFGTAAAYAKALGLNDNEKKLNKAVSDIYKGDEAATRMTENAVGLVSKHKKAA